jgi:hypothetical protein
VGVAAVMVDPQNLNETKFEGNFIGAMIGRPNLGFGSLRVLHSVPFFFFHHRPLILVSHITLTVPH